MPSRTRFRPVFWVANSIEVLERFSYYGIYMGSGIYMEYLGYTKAQLGIVKGIFCPPGSLPGAQVDGMPLTGHGIGA